MVEEKKKESEATVRVVDRRRFTDEGERRKDVEESSTPGAPHIVESAAPPPRAERAAAPPPPKSAAGAGPRVSEERRDARAGYKMDFETLVLSLSTTAMYQMGLMEGPGKGRIPADLEAARQTLDMLGVIEEKTRGNLSAREKQLLEQVLYELRLYFVQRSGEKTPSPSSAGS